ncbi:copper resistance D family protein [Aquipuribacter sp. MA13-6]|uniref:copper resistance D family protein n=1 Tax=unclassified Aquipuribacter TaxID=2635084 RepID=UPI003EED31CC
MTRTSWRTSGEPVVARRWWQDPVVVGLAAAMSGLLALLVFRELSGTRAPSGLDYAGPLTRELLPVARLGGELAAVAVVAGLMASLLPVRRVPDGPRAARLSPAVPVWALVWSVVSVASALLAASEISNQTVVEVLRTGLLLDYLTIIPQARYQLLAAVLALAVALVSYAASRSGDGPALPVLLLLLAGTGSAAALPLVTGHAASAANHYLALTTLIVHVLAALAWVGGLTGLVVHLRGHDEGLRVAVGRFDAVALTCFVVVALSGTVNAWIRVPDPGLLTSTTYGWLLLAKLAALVVLGAFGAWHRRRTIRELRAGRPTAFRRLAAAEVVVMTAAFGLAVALSRTPTP